MLWTADPFCINIWTLTEILWAYMPYSNNPIPTINPDAIPLSLSTVPSLPRKAPQNLFFRRTNSTNQTFDALILICRSIADLCDDLFSNGYEYIMTGGFQTDPLERKLSQYRQMSGGRFLISLKEVFKSESIIQMKTILKNSLEFVDYLPNIPFESGELIELVTEIAQNEGFENFTLSNDCKEVIVYISGNIAH